MSLDGKTPADKQELKLRGITMVNSDSELYENKSQKLESFSLKSFYAFFSLSSIS